MFYGMFEHPADIGHKIHGNMAVSIIILLFSVAFPEPCQKGSCLKSIAGANLRGYLPFILIKFRTFPEHRGDI